MINQTIAHDEIAAKIGRGAMGEVYTKGVTMQEN